MSFDAQQRAWLDAAELVDDKWVRAAEQAARVQQGFRRLLNDPDGDIALGQNTHELVTRLLSALPLARSAEARDHRRRVPHHPAAARSPRRRGARDRQGRRPAGRNAGRASRSRRRRCHIVCARIVGAVRHRGNRARHRPRGARVRSARHDAARRRVSPSERRAVRHRDARPRRRVRDRRRIQVLSARRRQRLPARAARVPAAAGADRLVQRVRRARAACVRRSRASTARAPRGSAVRPTIPHRTTAPPRCSHFTSSRA